MPEIDKRRAHVINREAGKAGLRGKIDAKCAECIYDPYSSGTWRKQVEECTDTGCPLWTVRPTANYGDSE